MKLFFSILYLILSVIAFCSYFSTSKGEYLPFLILGVAFLIMSAVYIDKKDC